MSTSDPRDLSVSRLIRASREQVFDVWTQPDHIKNWWGPEGFTNTISKMDVVPGGEWHLVMHGPDGKDYKNKSVFKEVVRPERLVIDHVSGPKYEMTVTFEEKGKDTLLTISMRFETAQLRDTMIREVGADKGLIENVDKLERYIARIKLT